MSFVFFASTGRTGTDFFTHLFNHTIENSWSLHEPKPAFRRRSYELAGRRHTQYEKYYFSLPRRHWHSKRPEDCYVETNYHLFAATPLIRDAFPEAKVFHIIRDGRDVVTSWLNRYRYITNDHITPHHIPGEPAQEHWEQWNPLQKLAWYWKTVNNLALSRSPDQVIYFERLFRRDPESIFEILEEIPDIHYDPETVLASLEKPVNKNKIEFYPKYAEWPSHWKRQFWDIAGETMEELGYREK